MSDLDNDDSPDDEFSSSSSSSNDDDDDRPSMVKGHVQYFNSEAVREIKNKANKNKRDKDKTITKTLADLDLPSLDDSRRLVLYLLARRVYLITRIVTRHQENINSHHSKALTKLMNKHIQQFPRWDYYLRNGYNVLLYGLGSKKKLVESFALYLSRKPGPMAAITVAHGYAPSFSLPQLVETIGMNYFGLRRFPVGMKSILSRCKFLVEMSAIEQQGKLNGGFLISSFMHSQMWRKQRLKS